MNALIRVLLVDDQALVRAGFRIILESEPGIVVVGDPRPVPGTIGLSLYRIAQEALTNTRKHAGAGATAELRLRYETDAVELEVTDTGRGAPQRSAGAKVAAGGLGQQGMRERVAAVGGTLELANRPRGGYLVRARVPLGGATAGPAVPVTAEMLLSTPERAAE